MKPLLVDTGPLIAYLSRRDPAHGAVAANLDGFSGEIHTIGTIITEAVHLVTADSRGPSLLAEFVTASRMRMHDFSQPADLRAAAVMMARYSDAPMDYADATLVLLAERLRVFDILTLDRRGFSIYRTGKGRVLRIFNQS